MKDRGATSEVGVPTLADTDRIRDIASHFRTIIELLGLDLADPNLVETPERVAKMYLELFAGPLGGRRAEGHVLPQRGALHLHGHGEGHPLLLAVLASLRPVLRPRPRRVHPERVDRRPLEDGPHRRVLRPSAPAPGAADRADRELHGREARSPGRDGRHRGAPPLRRDARRQEARRADRDVRHPRNLQYQAGARGVPRSPQSPADPERPRRPTAPLSTSASGRPSRPS